MSIKQNTILVVDDESDITALLKDILEDDGYRVLLANNAKEADKIYQQNVIDLVLLDIWMPEEDGISLLKRWSEQRLKSQVIVMSGHGTIETAVQATKIGAFDFIEKPLSMAKLSISLENVFAKVNLEKQHNELVEQTNPEIKIIGKSPVILELKKQLEAIKDNHLPTTFTGAFGTGKNTYARYLHQLSGSRGLPFIAINTASYDEQSLLNLFDETDKNSLFNSKGGGSVYFNELSELPFSLQKRLSFILNNHLLSHFRFCFGSQQGLKQLKIDEKLEETLFFELQMLEMQIPPLSEYRDDIPEIINYFTYHFVDTERLPLKQFSIEALNYLRQYNWPGNLQELKNFIQRSLVFAENQEITLDEIKELLSSFSANQEYTSSINIDLPIREAREQFEKMYFTEQLANCGGNIAQLAERAGLERTNLYRKLKSLGIKYK